MLMLSAAVKAFCFRIYHFYHLKSATVHTYILTWSCLFDHHVQVLYMLWEGKIKSLFFSLTMIQSLLCSMVDEWDIL